MEEFVKRFCNEKKNDNLEVRVQVVGASRGDWQGGWSNASSGDFGQRRSSCGWQEYFLASEDGEEISLGKQGEGLNAATEAEEFIRRAWPTSKKSKIKVLLSVKSWEEVGGVWNHVIEGQPLEVIKK